MPGEWPWPFTCCNVVGPLALQAPASEVERERVHGLERGAAVLRAGVALLCGQGGGTGAYLEAPMRAAVQRQTALLTQVEARLAEGQRATEEEGATVEGAQGGAEEGGAHKRKRGAGAVTD